jgi:murein DD-endopeptidase MepM/ murein hydrolase activator NlpD
LLAVGGTATPVAGDELAEARERQRELAEQLREQRENVAELNALQGQLKGEISETQTALADINADLRVVRHKVATMAERVEIVRARYRDLVQQLADLDAELVRLEAEEAAKRIELAQRKAELAERIRRAYEADRTSLLESILSAGSFTDVMAEVSYQLDIAEQDRQLALEIMHAQEVLAAIHETTTQVRIETEKMRVATNHQRRELSARLADLRAARRALHKLEEKTERYLAEQRASYAQLARNKAALQAAIERTSSAKASLARRIDRLIEEQMRRGNIPSEYNGTFRWPMTGTISQEFGCTGFSWEPPFGDCAHFHSGIDIVAPYGTPVRAAGAGTVVYIGWNYADGYDPAWIVVIAHSTNLQTWYAHLQPRYPTGIREGSQVKSGQIVGWEGNTGHSTGAHLHWMVELNSQFVNPRLFL